MASGWYKQSYRGGYVGEGYVPGYPPPGGASAPPATGLKLWLKSDKGVTLSGSNVTAWADQSGAGNDTIAPTTHPTFVSNSLNGLPGLNFNVANVNLSNTGSNVVTRGSARTVIAVATPVANAGGVYTDGGPVLSFGLGSLPVFGFDLGVRDGGVFGYTDQSSVFDSVTSPPSIVSVPSVSELYSAGTGTHPTYAYNGTTYVLGVGNVTNENATAGFVVGNVHAGLATLFFAGLIYEVLVYDHVLSAGDVTTVRQYLQARYAIALGV